MRPTANARGDAYIDRLRKEFLHLAPRGEWTHHPHAHLLAAGR
jgi:hypothetical protein